MSLLPIIFDDYFMHPSRILDQRFGVGLDLDDMLTPLERTLIQILRASLYYRPWRSTVAKNDTGSTVVTDKDKFQLNVDVQQFNPEEISVKVSGNIITVEGKHEEQRDEHGLDSRHFVRKYVLPDGHDINQVVSNLSSDGVLSIAAPRVEGGDGDGDQHAIPIQQTGASSKSIEKEE